MANTNQIVQKLWNLCDILRDGGVDYMNFVNELTFILFPKMLEEKGLDKKWLPEDYRWKDLAGKNGVEQFDFYRKMLLELGTQKSKLRKHQRVLDIYTNANTSLKEPKHLSLIVTEINKIDWHSQDKDDLGDMYEGLLEKMGSERKSGAGQYFTPRPLIESIVDLLQPQPGEEIQDPAAGTCGFLIYADKYIKNQTDDLFKLKTSEQEFQKKEAFYGIEFVPVTHRLALMNLMLHDMESELTEGNTLGEAGANLKPADVILSNPPFGTAKGDGGSTRSDLTYETSNKQLSFLQHIYRSLKPGGRAGVVLPDNVLFESGVGSKVRKDLMDKCNLHTILRLPTGIFYAQGVKTNVLFFTKGKKETGNTKETWVYDLRANMPSFGKTSPLKREHFAEFEKAYGKKPDGNTIRKDQGEEGRFRCFSIDVIKKRDYNLDISWLRDESLTHSDDLPEPEELLAEIVRSLRNAAKSFEEINLDVEKKMMTPSDIKSISDIYEIQNGFAFKSSEFSSSGIPVIRISDIQDEHVSLKDAVHFKKSDKYDRYEVSNGDILIALSGATTGKFGIYKNDQKAYLNQRVARFRPKKNDLIANRWLYYFFHYKRQEILKEAWGGGTAKYLNEKNRVNANPLSKKLKNNCD